MLMVMQRLVYCISFSCLWAHCTPVYAFQFQKFTQPHEISLFVMKSRNIAKLSTILDFIFVTLSSISPHSDFPAQAQLETNLAKRAEHYFSENTRVLQGTLS